VLADGRPAAFVTIELQERDTNRNPQWMWWSTTTSDREGNFRFVGCPHQAHPVRLHVNGKAGSFAGEPFPLLQPGAKHAAGDLQLHPPSTIEGVLRSRDRAVPGICIRVLHRQSGSVFETLTDREGRFRLLGVAPGPVYLHQFDGSRVQHPVELAVEPFEVEAGKAYTFDLELQEK
jgi:hypothetical protein